MARQGRKLPTIIDEKEFFEGIKKIKELNPPKKTTKSKIKLAFMLGFYQGMRISEVVNLKPADVDIDEGFIKIRQGKGKKDAYIPIMKPVVRGMKHLPIGIGIRTLQNHFKKCFPAHHFHTLRHSSATFYLNDKKVDVKFVQQLLRHSRLTITELYTHINPHQLKEYYDDVWR